MTIASILSAVPISCTAAPARVTRQVPTPPTDAESTGSCSPTAATEEESRFPTEDRVELSVRSAEADLMPLEQERIEELKQRDTEVREHEAAHLAAAGGYARGAAQFEYTTGPDGKAYAVGGEVQIDTAPVDGDPEATIRKMETVQAAAMAPRDPSAQDVRVASEAARQIQQARAEQTQHPQPTSPGRTNSPPPAPAKSNTPAAWAAPAGIDSRPTLDVRA